MEEEVKRWIEKAEKDLKVAEFNLNGKQYEAAGFFTQQAVEKALKALYVTSSHA